MAEEMNEHLISGKLGNVWDTSNSEVLALVVKLRSTCDGWKKCVESLINGEIQDERLQFLCLQTIEHYLKNNYNTAPQLEQDIVRQFLSRWIQLKCGELNVSNPIFLKNKAAQIFALVFIHDFPDRWPMFFSDLINTMNMGPRAVENFIRVLSAIDAEIANKNISYTNNEIRRNNSIKDAMRITCLDEIVSALHKVINTYEVTQPQLVSQCLQTLSDFIHWIDIRFVTNDQFFGTLLRLLNLPDIRESVVLCIRSIVQKGMDPADKFSFVETLMSFLNNTGVFVCSTDDDSEFCCKVSHLINEIGVALLESYRKITKNGTSDQALAVEQAVDVKVPIMIEFLKNDYDDVSSAVLNFAKEYIHFLRRKPVVNERQLKNIQDLIVTVVHKLKYDETYNFNNEGEEEAEFQNFRKKLKSIFGNLINLNKDLVLNYVLELSTRTFVDWKNFAFADVEVTLAVLGYASEVLPGQGGQYETGDRAGVEKILQLLLDSGLGAHPHPAVGLQFFETIVRYQRIFLSETPRILSVISQFLGQYGLRHSNAKVRSRTAYLFCKFIKGSKCAIQTYTNDILSPLQELLRLPNILSNGEKEQWMSAEDQLFLFETVGIIIVCSTVMSNEEKVYAFKKIIIPIVSKYESLLNDLSQENNKSRREALTNTMCHMIAITTHTSKAFTAQSPVKSIGCESVYTQCLVTFLRSIQVSVEFKAIQSSIRQFLHRMVECLENELLPYIPQACGVFLKNIDIESIQELLPILVQIFSKFKNNVTWHMRDCLMTIIEAIFNALKSPLEEADEDGIQEKCALRKLYFQFLSALITNSSDLFHAQQYFVKQEILISVIEGTNDPCDPDAQKRCFSVYRKLVQSYSSKTKGSDFAQYILQTGIGLCFQIIHTVTCNPLSHNGDRYMMEVALVLKALYAVWGEELLSLVLTNPQISPESREELLKALKSDAKVLKNYLKAMCHVL